MAEYIRSVSPALQQAILQAQAMKAENKTRSTQNIAGAVASAINDYYKDKEMKIQQAKENKLKESLALLEFAKNYETANLPAGVRGVPQGGIQPLAPSIGAREQISMPGYQPVPEALRAMGVTGQMFRPREQAAQMLVTPEQHAAALTAYKDNPEVVKKLTTTTQPGMKYNDFVKAVQVATKEAPLPKPAAIKPVSPTDPIEAADPELAGYGVPLTRPNPYKGMSDTLLSRVKSSNIAAGNRAVEDVQKISESAATTSASLARAQSLLDAGLKTGPAVGASETARKLLSKDAAEFIQIANLTLPSMRQGMPGVVSDRDMEIFKRANIGISQPESVNKKVISQGLAISQRATDKARFFANYMAVYGDTQGATAAWNKYITNVPLFSKDGSVLPVIPFEEYFAKGANGKAPAAPAKDPAPAKASPKDDLDKALDELGI